ncbi:hypothetical protein M0R72_19225 [Candidatus Pacearchaeota archaeon]|jgi:hypothetical protein|nr:hypothetical protein [Candidatus Pacearchaeota archaeon]
MSESLIAAIKRLAELEQKVTPMPWSIDMQVDPKIVLRDTKFFIALRNAAPAMMKVLSLFEPGDASDLAFVLSGEWQPGTCVCESCQKTTATVRRLQKAARLMEAEG